MSDIDFKSILPRNSTFVEKAFERAGHILIDETAFANTRHPDECPEKYLPFLAWQLSVDDWDSEWTVEQKRDAIRESANIHRSKGTVGSIRRALETFGYGEAVISEGFFAESFDGSLNYDGDETHGIPDQWAEYRIYLKRPITNKQSDRLRKILEAVAPARSHLKQLYFQEVAFTHDAQISFDGTYNYGAA